jgi:guanylate kinase
MAKIYVLMGKSATGKDTIYKKILENNKIDLKEVVTYTTRPIRDNEQDGVEYNFVTEEFFNEMKNNNNIIEYRTYNTIHGLWYYFMVNDGQIDIESDENYIIIGTLESFAQIRGYYGKEVVIPIYIEIEDGERLTRALKREKEQIFPKYEELCRRFLADSKDYSDENLQENDIKIRYTNIEVDKCVSQIIQDMD